MHYEISFAENILNFNFPKQKFQQYKQKKTIRILYKYIFQTKVKNFQSNNLKIKCLLYQIQI